MAVQFKPGVNMKVVPQILTALSQIEHIFARYGYIPVVTSANDGSHSPGSLHYKGAALDIRSKGLPSDVKSQILDAMKALGKPWYVILEFPGGTSEHFHIQYGLAIRDSNRNIIGYTTSPVYDHTGNLVNP